MKGSRNKGQKINTRCILKPLEKLTGKFRVYVIYLRKSSTRNMDRDALMGNIASITIETTHGDYDKSAELEKFLQQVVAKSR